MNGQLDIIDKPIFLLLLHKLNQLTQIVITLKKNQGLLSLQS